jgi:four helix bundle protein
MTNDEWGGDRIPLPEAGEPPPIQERAFLFACRVVRPSRHLDSSVAGRHLAGQLLRAGTSVGANLEEAHAAQTKRDFVAKVSIALKEARETLYWLRIIRACRLIPPLRLELLIREANELVSILTVIRKRSQVSLHVPGDPRR